MSPRESLLVWLTNAYTAEMSVINKLEQHVVALEGFEVSGTQELKERLVQHIAESHQHAEKVTRCVRTMKGDPSVLGLATIESPQALSGATSAMADDAVLRNMMDDYAAEHMEMALYNVIIAAAQEMGEAEVAESCREILAQEVAMASWLNDSFPSFVSEFLRQQGQ